MKLKLVLMGLIFSVCAVSLYAEDTAAPAAEPTAAPSSSSSSSDSAANPFGFGMQFGSVTINGTNYNTIRLQPDLAFGDFGIGLDVNFEFNANGDFRYGEWNTWQAWLTKITYVRYGKKGKPFYIQAGGNNNFTFGNGFILNRYSNMLNFPAFKKTGLALDCDFNIAGFESMVDNIFDFDIMGLRAYVRPLADSKILVFDRLEFGISAVGDLDPQNPAPSAEKPYEYSDSTNNRGVLVYGVDAGLPIINIDNFLYLKAFADFAMIAGQGSGEAAGLLGSIFSIVPYRLEFRVLQPHFMPGYFDTFYDIDRSTRYEALNDITNGYMGVLFSSGFGLLKNPETKKDMLVFNAQYEQNFASESKPALEMSLSVDKALLMDMLGIQLSYTRRNIDEWVDLVSIENVDSMMSATIDYYVSKNMAINIVYKRTFEIDSTGAVVPFTTTLISTKISF